MNLNPEFKRQLILECSQSRLIGIPLILWVIFTFTFYLDDHRLGEKTAQTALLLYMLIALLWGARQSMDSLTEEYRERTWDTQRLSALGAWEMICGKLFGSTVMAWYAGLICLGVYSLSTENTAGLALLLFYSIGIGLLIQSGSLLLGQLNVQRGQIKNSSMFVPAVIGFIFIAPWLTNLSGLAPANSQFDFAVTAWYGMDISTQFFQQFSLLLAIFWTMIGNYRLMAQELGIRCRPWAWLAFSLFLMVYLGGFMPSLYAFCLTAFTVCGALTYIGVMVERNDAMRINRLLTFVKQTNWQRFGEDMPIWCLSFILAVPFALLLSVIELPAAASIIPEDRQSFLLTIPLLLMKSSGHAVDRLDSAFHFYPVPILLILLRDCAIYLYFSYGKNPQRALSLTLITGVLLYGIFPVIFSFAGLTWLSALSFPLWADSAIAALICALLQSAFVFNLLYKRWLKIV